MATSPPPGMGLASFTEWWSTQNKDQMAAWDAGAQKIGAARASLSSWQNAWQPIKWEGSPWQTRYNTQQTGMDALLSKIQGYGTSEDMAAANNMVAQSYGMTPEQYAAIQAENTRRMTDQNYAAQSDASAANAYLENIANSTFAQEQQQADRVAMRQAEEAIGKQLESIFGERGGMGGFQAAYELTSQLQSSYLQQQTQQHLGMFNQAVAAVNANNGYFQNLIQQGALSAKDYLSMRFDQLQTGYQDYLAAMAQTMQEWQTIEAVDEQQFKLVSDNLQSQIDNMTDQMTLEMGGETTLEGYIQSLYNIYTQPLKDAEALANEKSEAMRGAGTGLLTAGASIAAIGGPAGWIIGGLLCVVGLGLTLAGSGTSGGGTTTTTPTVNPGADRDHGPNS